jgi:hypothetical protein
MKVDVVLGGNRHAVKRSRLVAPLAERRHDLFVDPMPDGLQDTGFDDSALRVNGHFDNDVALQIAREFGTRDWRVGIYDRISHMHFVAGDWAIDHRAERRTRTGIVLGSLGIGRNQLMVGGRFRR